MHIITPWVLGIRGTPMLSRKRISRFLGSPRIFWVDNIKISVSQIFTFHHMMQKTLKIFSLLIIFYAPYTDITSGAN